MGGVQGVGSFIDDPRMIPLTFVLMFLVLGRTSTDNIVVVCFLEIYLYSSDMFLVDPGSIQESPGTTVTFFRTFGGPRHVMPGGVQET